MFFYIQLLTFVSIVFGSPIVHNVSNRIMGGKVTTIEKRPYMVSIMYWGEFYCGGSILNARWILTAGHCIGDPKDISVRVGSTYKNESGQIFKIKRALLHPKFVPEPYIDYDVGLMDLGANMIPLNGKTMVPVELNPAPVTAGTKVDLSGWGYITDSKTTNVLMEAETVIFDHDECAKEMNYPVVDTMVCIAPGPKSGCEGDSGSPLVLSGTYKQVGIVSLPINSHHCNNASFPFLLTYVSYPKIRNWIKNTSGV